jgi:predicted TIM-barrel fold metal-dependent hydrolase
MGYAAIEKLVLALGDERLLFGSGAPFQRGAATLSKILHANISDAARERIAGANACRLLRIET